MIWIPKTNLVVAARHQSTMKKPVIMKAHPETNIQLSETKLGVAYMTVGIHLVWISRLNDFVFWSSTVSRRWLLHDTQKRDFHWIDKFTSFSTFQVSNLHPHIPKDYSSSLHQDQTTVLLSLSETDSPKIVNIFVISGE